MPARSVVVIGSGATAVTLVPAMADSGAAHVTMLQRSPTYMAVRPSQDPFATKMRRRLPLKLAYMVTRWKNVLLGMYFYQMCKRQPDKVKSLLLGYVRQMLGPDYDVGTHFTPRYNPWDQRLCLVPDADFFRAIRQGKVSVVTDQIETFTETGIRLKSGAELEADLIVTATGLVLVPLGGVKLTVDGRAVDPAKTFIYKGMMYSDVPNLASVFGYTNASWTLKADLVCEYVCRLLNHMDRTRHAPVHAAQQRSRRCRRSRGSTSPPATSSARWRTSPSRAPSGRGSSTRTTRSICSACASARSATKPWCSRTAAPARGVESAKTERACAGLNLDDQARRGPALRHSTWPWGSPLNDPRPGRGALGGRRHRSLQAGQFAESLPIVEDGGR